MRAAMLGLQMPDKGNKRKAAAAAGHSQAGVKELLDFVAKLSLAHALSARVLRSIVLDAMHVPITSEIVLAMNLAAKAFVEAHRPASKEERAKMCMPGMPHHHAWNAMLEQVTKEAKPGVESRAIKDYSHFVKQQSDPVKILTVQVGHVRVCK